MSEKVIVLGGSGMLGSMVVDYLSQTTGLKVAATVRSEALALKCREKIPDVDWLLFDGGTPDVSRVLNVLDGYGWVINAIGITKPLIHDDNAAEVERAIRINSLLPHQIARKTETSGASVLQIATDCVYSGRKGEYLEGDEHDALDGYGKTKSLGEVTSASTHHLRCSIIAREPKEHKFLVDWFLNQPKNAAVNGFANHRWNGVTTLHFARLCYGIIMSNISLPHLQHVVPAGEVTKYELLQCFGRYFHREDISISPTQAAVVVDRTLKTENEVLNKELWKAAGYARPPSVPEMVAELAEFKPRLFGL